MNFSARPRAGTARMLAASVCVWSLGLSSCSRPPTVLVSVEDLPAETASLHVLPLHAGLGPHAEVEPIDVPLPAPGRTTFLLRLPDAFVGDLSVEVAAYKGAGATSCILATGSGKLSELQGKDSSLRIPVQPISDTVCSGKRPLLLGASPGLGLIDGNETIQLTGWGFKPGIVAQFGSNGSPPTFTSATTQFVSATRMDALTPARVNIGPTDIKVLNKDASSHTRSDLFRYYASKIDLGQLPVNPAGSSNDVSDLLIGNLVPKIPTAVASLAATFRSQNNMRLVWTIPAQPIPMIDSKTITFSQPGSAPSGISTSDMDGDGILDLVVALSGASQVQIFLNDGQGGLTEQPALSTGNQPEGIATGDLNGDGKPDIVTANKGSNSVSIILSKPGGGYLAATSLTTSGQGPVSVVISDVNQDGIKDITSLNSIGQNISVFLGMGLGLFTSKSVEFIVGKDPTMISQADVNRDGIEDLVIVNRGDNNVQVLVNRSKGSINFDVYTLVTDQTPESVSFSDMNGDGVRDLLIACSGSNTVDVFLNQAPDGLKKSIAQSFKMPGAPSCTGGIRRVAAMDIITDGQMDLVGLCLGGGGLLKNQTL